jgi:hypothetical protein
MTFPYIHILYLGWLIFHCSNEKSSQGIQNINLWLQRWTAGVASPRWKAGLWRDTAVDLFLHNLPWPHTLVVLVSVFIIRLSWVTKATLVGFWQLSVLNLNRRGCLIGRASLLIFLHEITDLEWSKGSLISQTPKNTSAPSCFVLLVTGMHSHSCVACPSHLTWDGLSPASQQRH